MSVISNTEFQFGEEKKEQTHTEVKWCAKANEIVCVRLYVRDVNGSERVRDNMNMWANEIYKYL